jgi:hypothetical protein
VVKTEETGLTANVDEVQSFRKLGMSALDKRFGGFLNSQCTKTAMRSLGFRFTSQMTMMFIFSKIRVQSTLGHLNEKLGVN